MEDTQRNVPTSVDGESSQRWTLMFIGDKGQVLTIRRFKGVAVSVAILVVILALVSVSLFFFYRRPAQENMALRTQLTGAEKAIAELTHEKDRLTARLVLIETQLTATAPAQTAPTSPKPTEGESPPATPAAGEGVESPAPKPAAEAPPPEPPKMEMNVTDLKTVRDSRDDALRLRYTLKNVNTAVKPARGRTFVILEPEDGTPEHYLSYPRTSLVNGKPESWRKGRYFSINRFNIIRFKTTETMDTKLYTEARVLVYTRTGELILEKVFPVNIPEPKPEPIPISDGSPPPQPEPPPQTEAPVPAATAPILAPSTPGDTNTEPVTTGSPSGPTAAPEPELPPAMPAETPGPEPITPSPGTTRP